MSCPYCRGYRKVKLYALDPTPSYDAVSQTIEPDVRDKEFPCPACSTIPKDAIETFATQVSYDLSAIDYLSEDNRNQFNEAQLKQMLQSLGDHLAKEKEFYKEQTFHDDPHTETKRVTLKLVKNSFDTEELEQERIDEILAAMTDAALNHILKFNNYSYSDSWKFIYNYELRQFIFAMFKDPEFKEVLKYFIERNRMIDYK